MKKRFHSQVRLVHRLAAAATALFALLAFGAPSNASAEFGLVPGSFHADSFEGDGTFATQAGGYPFVASSGFTLITPNGQLEANMRDVEVVVPPGLIGNPEAASKCPRAEFNGIVGGQGICPSDSQIGVVEISYFTAGVLTPPAAYPLYNLVPRKGVAAEFGLPIFTVGIHIDAGLTDDGTYRISVKAKNLSESVGVWMQKFTLWGVPSDPEHDSLRACGDQFIGGDCLADRTWIPFLSNPTSCAGPQTSRVRVRSWAEHDVWHEDTYTTATGATGCESVPFEPSITIAPSSSRADSPTGLDVRIEVPQNEDGKGIASSHLKDTVVRFPAGVEINPAAGDGLAGCTMGQIGVSSTSPVQFNGAKAACPDSSRIGTVEIDSPLLDHNIEGVVYQGKPDNPSAPGAENPFDSLLALYVEVDDPESGTRFKLASKVVAKDGDGRLVSTFADSPQLPFSSFELHLDGGEQAPLVTPATCGTYATEAVLTGWSGAQRKLTSEFTIDSGPGGGPCPAGRPFDVGFKGGLVNGTAGSSSPFVLQLTRPDGSQEISSFEVDLPQGLTSKLAGVPYCPEAALATVSGTVGSGAAQIAAPSCPAASQVGTAVIGTGAGANPLYVETGKAYLAGPYKGAPLSLAVITPAVAGPFDLGSVLVRSAIHVDPDDAQVHVSTDPLPQVLHGIPLRMRDIRVRMDRPGFMQAPTNCKQMQLAAQVTSVLGAVSPEAQGFRVADCGELGFKPKLSFRFKGKTHRSAHPAVTTTLKAREGDANIGKAVVTLPKTQFLEQDHIRTICTRVQYAADNCPKASVYGYAKAWTPLLGEPLQGPVYLRSSSNTLPDLVVDLNGQIEIDLAGRIDTVNQRMRVSFESVPDAPVAKFVLRMQGGKKGLLVNNEELCKVKPRASAVFTGQNGKRSASNPLVKIDCGKGAARRK